MKHTRRTVLKGIAAAAATAAGALAGESAAASRSRRAARGPDPDDLTLWYGRPANTWLEALPIGNGRLGAMVFGGLPVERLQLNEGTLWAGAPHDYTSPEALAALPEIRRLVFAGEWKQAQDLVNAKFLGRPAGQMPYQTVGNLTLTFASNDAPEGYRRELDLDSAIVRTTYNAGGVRYTREAFASAPDGVILLRLSADQPGRIAFTMACGTPQPGTLASATGSTLSFGRDAQSGGPNAIGFRALARVLPEGGSVDAGADTVTVRGADAVTILVSIATSYRDWQNPSADPTGPAAARLEAAARKPYDRLRRAHVTDYRRLFRRVSLELGSGDTAADGGASRRPTNDRIAVFKAANDPRLAALHFQYGRYLLISCSRLGGQPATLQGLWNDSMSPPWGSKYTININTEMNYWPAGPTNLAECWEPLFAMLADLSVAGRRTARGAYGADGWVCHHNTDAWRGTAPVDGAFWGMWPMGGAWLCKSIWDHYEVTQDRAALERHYPTLRGAAEFFLASLVEEPSHRWLVTCPSVSPENAHHPDCSICAGPTMDMQILRDLFEAVSRASELLGTDAELRRRVTVARGRLAPMQIGRLGQLQEWLEDWDAGAPEQHHRHVSHLYGLFPSAQITRHGTPELFAAARKSLELRGDMATGWSLAWKINLWARLQDGDRAYKLLSDLLTPQRTAPNLFDLHPPFQIDGNFGATSGITEMLLQSHAGEIELLPALPSAWPEGAARGLRARGGFEMDLTWRGGRLTGADIRSLAGRKCTVRLGETVVSFPTQAGKRYRLNGTLGQREARA